MQGCESVGSSKQVCLIDSSLDNILSSFPFCCVVISLDVIAAMTLETGQPTFCPSDWTTALHWRPYYHSWWNNKISYEVKHLIKSYIRKCHQEVHHSVLDGWTSCIMPAWVLSLLKPVESLLPLFPYSSGHRIVPARLVKARPEGFLKPAVTLIEWVLFLFFKIKFIKKFLRLCSFSFSKAVSI